MPDKSAGEFGSFNETHWSLVGRVQHGDDSTHRAALDDLLRTYFPPLRAHLVLGKRIEPNLAEDLLQGFVADRVLEKDLIARADREKGKFRSLLLRSLENYTIDWFRRETARHRAEEGKGRQGVGQPYETVGQGPPITDPFIAEWARQVLSQALKQMYSECQQQGRGSVWGVFVARVLRPLVTTVPPTPYEALVREYELSTPEQASNTLMTAKRQFQRTVRDIIAGYCTSEDEIEDEIADLRNNLLSVTASDLGSVVEHLQLPPAQTSDEYPDIEESTPDLLAELLEVQADRDSLWTETDMGALLRHQMAIPLRRVFASWSGDAPFSVEHPTTLPDLSFDDLLKQDQPPLDILSVVKRLARKSVRDDRSVLPDEIAKVLYFASIALALLHHKENISRSDDKTLRVGMLLTLSRPWIEGRLAELLQEAVQQLDEPSSSNTEG